MNEINNHCIRYLCMSFAMTPAVLTELKLIVGPITGFYYCELMSYSQLRFNDIVVLLTGNVSPIAGVIVTVATNWVTSLTRGQAATVTITTRTATRHVDEEAVAVVMAGMTVAIVTARSGTGETEGTTMRNSLTTGRTTIVPDVAVTKATGRSGIVVVTVTTDRSVIVTTDRSGTAVVVVVIGLAAARRDSTIAATVTSITPGQGRR